MKSTASSLGSKTQRFPDSDRRWKAVVARDGRADGTFFYSVATTGIYCRPSCPARRPLRRNVAFHASCGAAEAAGFRPCKRCRPHGASLADQRIAAVVKACRIVEAAETPPRLDQLAAAVGLSPSYFHRAFKEVTGLTPNAYARAERAERVRAELPMRRTVAEALYGAGFNSHGRFYAASSGMLGMKPSQFRRGGAGESLRFAVGECSLGSLLVAASARGICAIALGDDPEGLVRDLQDRFPQARLSGGDAEFDRWVAKIVGSVEAPHLGSSLPLDVRGTAFQRRVWQALREIPAGATSSYTEVARRLGKPKAVRAVAQACASNTIAVAIPCHRVVRMDGGLAGYRWGVERKRALLDREKLRQASSRLCRRADQR